jgi:hypothetical protein
MSSIKFASLFLWAVALSAACSGVAIAQRTPAQMFQQDSARAAGEHAGNFAADAAELTFVAPAAFVVGVPVGFLGTLALMNSSAGSVLPQSISGTGLLVAAGVGAVLVTVLKRAGGTSHAVKPAPTVLDLPPDSLFKIASRQSYEHRLMERRANRILWGSAAGVALGVVLIFRLLPYT